MQQWILAACVLGALPRAEAAMTVPIREQSLPMLARASSRIFVGTVRQLRYRPGPRDGLITTHVGFGAVTVLKGRPSASPGGAEFVIRVAGGRDTDGTWVQVAGVPRFRIGERYLIFEKAGSWRYCSLAGGEQGCYHLVRRPAGGGWVVLDASDAPVLAVEEGRLRRARPRPAAEPPSLFGASVPRGVGRGPWVAPIITRVTGAEPPSAAVTLSAAEIARAMPAATFLAEVRRICVGN